MFQECRALCLWDKHWPDLCELMRSESLFHGTQEMRCIRYVLHFKHFLIRYCASNITFHLVLVIVVKVSFCSSILRGWNYFQQPRFICEQLTITVASFLPYPLEQRSSIGFSSLSIVPSPLPREQRREVLGRWQWLGNIYHKDNGRHERDDQVTCDVSTVIESWIQYWR